MTKDCCGTECSCPCHRVIGLAIVLLGLTFLLHGLGVIPMHIIKIIWPVLVLGVGMKVLFKSKCCH